MPFQKWQSGSPTLPIQTKTAYNSSIKTFTTLPANTRAYGQSVTVKRNVGQNDSQSANPSTQQTIPAVGVGRHSLKWTTRSCIASTIRWKKMRKQTLLIPTTTPSNSYLKPFTLPWSLAFGQCCHCSAVFARQWSKDDVEFVSENKLWDNHIHCFLKLVFVLAWTLVFI